MRATATGSELRPRKGIPWLLYIYIPIFGILVPGILAGMQSVHSISDFHYLLRPPWRDYTLALLPFFLPLIAYSMFCAIILMVAYSRFSQYFSVRLGVYSGCVLAFQFHLLLGLRSKLPSVISSIEGYFALTVPIILFPILLLVAPDIFELNAKAPISGDHKKQYKIWAVLLGAALMISSVVWTCLDPMVFSFVISNIHSLDTFGVRMVVASAPAALPLSAYLALSYRLGDDRYPLPIYSGNPWNSCRIWFCCYFVTWLFAAVRIWLETLR